MVFIMKNFNNTALILAVSKNNADMVQILITQKEIDPNIKRISMKSHL